MKVRLKLFAAAKQFAGKNELDLELPPHATIATLRQAAVIACPAMSDLLARTRFAINHEYAIDETVIVENSEIACIPPVSGG